MNLSPGDRLEPYELTATGEGGMGTVWNGGQRREHHPGDHGAGTGAAGVGSATGARVADLAGEGSGA